ncbi:spore germination protein GerPE [Ammoniphilus sp. YIM 78166]|uniref:spore germination protein GerPE n=1 Tax=Ammoniphilus sp. YIM 78166 TaxID=1644106 RepID=UPI00106F5040|nr:spore germination protein GerPE [Ammoniphilus sp. YIM 78166]
MSRLSHVGKMKILNVSNTSVFEIGDSVNVHTYSRVLALKRTRPVYLGEEHDFSDYTVFNQPIPRRLVYESINMTVFNQNPVISVGSIESTSVSTASILHIGSTTNIAAEAHVKHVRHSLG